jgi:hypothetical protein
MQTTRIISVFVSFLFVAVAIALPQPVCLTLPFGSDQVC